METYQAIVTRRSIGKVTEDRPSKDEILRLLEAGIRAPTHHLTQPWRFIVLAGDSLSRLGDAWAAGEQREGRDPEKVRAKPLRAPVIITIVARPKSHLPKVVEIEEHHAIGALMQNILLAAHDMGLGAMIRTGNAAGLTEVRDYLGVAENEYVAGFIYVGYPQQTEERPLTRRAPVDEVAEWRGWE